MKTVGTLIKCRFVNRKEIEKLGVAFVFQTELGEITKTFNIPSFNSSKCDLFKLLTTKFGVNPPVGLIGKPIMFCMALESKLKGRDCDLTIIESGSEKYPYNIIDVEPILTIKSSSFTNQALV
jgi:hypothetical protein